MQLKGGIIIFMGSEHQILYNGGRTAMEKGEFARAVEMLKRSAELLPHFKTFESVGECLLELGNYAEADALSFRVRRVG